MLPSPNCAHAPIAAVLPPRDSTPADTRPDPFATYPTFSLPVVREFSLAAEDIANMELVDATTRRPDVVKGSARTVAAVWLATDRGLRIRDGKTGRTRKLELPLPAWSGPMVDCVAGGEIVWCINEQRELLQVKTRDYPLVSVRRGRHSLATAEPLSVVALEEGLFLLLANDRLGFIPPSFARASESSRLVEFDNVSARRMRGWNGYLVLETNQEVKVLALDELKARVHAPAANGAGSWVHRTSEYRPGQRVEEGVVLRGHVVPATKWDKPYPSSLAAGAGALKKVRLRGPAW